MKKQLLILVIISSIFLTQFSFAEENNSQDINSILNTRIDSIHNYFQQKPFSLISLKERPEISFIDKPDFTGLYSPNFGANGIIKVGPKGVEDAKVVYHEYVHALINKVFPQLSNYKTYQAEAIEEGIPQYFACSYSDDPNFNWGSDKRSIENKFNYPQDVKFDPYKDSYILCGALWDLRETIKNPIVADFLVYQSLYYKPKNFAEMLTSILNVNDQYYGNADNDISNDAWSQNILEVFARHGITTETSDTIYSAELIKKSELISSKPGADIVLWVKFQNTGPATWYNSPASPRNENDPTEKREIWLSKVYQKTEYGYTPSQIKSIKIAKLVEEKVKLHEIGTFKVSIKVPNKKGTYKYNFTPQALLTGNNNSPYSPKTYNMNSQVSWEITVI